MASGNAQAYGLSAAGPTSAGADPPHALHISRSPFSRSMTVTAGGPDAPPLYTARRHRGRKPAVEVHSAATGAAVGDATLHRCSHDIDLRLHGAAVALASAGALSSARHWASPAAGGAARCWRGRGNLVCEDERGEPRARFAVARLNPTRLGTLETVAGVAGPELDELLLSVLAIMDQRRRRRMAAGAAGSTAGATAGAY